MSEDVIIGPAGGCAQCYRKPCICGETSEQRQLRKQREQQRRLEKGVGVLVELLDCDECKQMGVVPDSIVRAFVCLRCGAQQKPRWTPE